jgi:hypothetical protein
MDNETKKHLKKIYIETETLDNIPSIYNEKLKNVSEKKIVIYGKKNKKIVKVNLINF